MNKNIYQFWLTGKSGATPPALKLPKRFRKKGSLDTRVLQSIKIDKKTGEYLRK